MSKRKKNHPNQPASVQENAAIQPRSPRRWLTWSLLGLTVLVAGGGGAWQYMRPPENPYAGPVTVKVSDDKGRTIGCKQTGEKLTTWDLLAMSDADLEKMSLVETNLVVAREIPGMEALDIGRYEQTTNAWASEFAAELPKAEVVFRQTPEKWKNDLNFFRLGILMNFLGARKQIVYVPELRQTKPGEAKYTQPGLLFVDGLMDKRQGTCANMPVLQVAIARKLGWPVSLAPAQRHSICRWDDGKHSFNIETTQTDKGGFSSGTNEEYAQRKQLPPCGIKEGMELKTMTAREMLGLFIAHRGRYWMDKGDMDKADQDLALARAIIPRHRAVYEEAHVAAERRARKMFEPMEQGHPEFARNTQLQQVDSENNMMQLMAENQARQDAQVRQRDAMNDYNRRMQRGELRPGEQAPSPFAPLPGSQLPQNPFGPRPNFP